MKAFEAVIKRGGPNLSSFYTAEDLYWAYMTEPNPGLSIQSRSCWAIAAAYECGIIEGIRSERARRAKGKGKK